MRPRIAALCLAVLAVSAGDGPGPAKEMSPKERKVRRLLEVTGSGDMGRQILDTMMDQFKAMPGLPEGFTDKVRESANVEALTERIVPVYLKHYEEADLDAAIAFYESPAGKRLVEHQGPALKESMEIGQKWGEELAEKALAMIKDARPVGANSNEALAEKALRTLIDAQANFLKADYDNNGKDFCGTLAGLHDQVDAAGNKIALIPKTLASGTKGGYAFTQMATYNPGAHGGDRRYGFAYCAVPTDYGKTGRRTYISRMTGEIWFKDQGISAAVTDWVWKDDADLARDGWVRLGE